MTGQPVGMDVARPAWAVTSEDVSDDLRTDGAVTISHERAAFTETPREHPLGPLELGVRIVQEITWVPSMDGLQSETEAVSIELSSARTASGRQLTEGLSGLPVDGAEQLAYLILDAVACVREATEGATTR